MSRPGDTSILTSVFLVVGSLSTVPLPVQQWDGQPWECEVSANVLGLWQSSAVPPVPDLWLVMGITFLAYQQRSLMVLVKMNVECEPPAERAIGSKEFFPFRPGRWYLTVFMQARLSVPVAWYAKALMSLHTKNNDCHGDRIASDEPGFVDDWQTRLRNRFSACWSLVRMSAL